MSYACNFKLGTILNPRLFNDFSRFCLLFDEIILKEVIINHENIINCTLIFSDSFKLRLETFLSSHCTDMHYSPSCVLNSRIYGRIKWGVYSFHRAINDQSSKMILCLEMFFFSFSIAYRLTEWRRKDACYLTVFSLCFESVIHFRLVQIRYF